MAHLAGRGQLDAQVGQAPTGGVISERTGAQPVAFELMGIADPQVQPEPVGLAEIALETSCGVGAYGGLHTGDLVDATRRNADRNCQATLVAPQPYR